MSSRVARLFEGWQVGVVTVGIVALVAAVVVPRSASPDGLPPPSVTRSEIRVAEQRTRDQALAATDGLSQDVALLGARLRVLGRAEASGDGGSIARAGASLSEAARPALAKDPGGVVKLRAYQALRFVDGYHEYLLSGQTSDELIELGGDTLAQLKHEDWVQNLETAPPDYRVILTAIYKRRFKKLVGSHPALDYDPVEERVLIGYFLEHPPRTALASNESELEATQGKFLLAQLDDLAKLEPAYPFAFAKGIVLYRMGRYEESSSAFDFYLQTVENGPYRLRAVNYLKASIENGEGGP